MPEIITQKKFLDQNGLTYFAGKYTTKEVLEAVIDGIQDALEEKADIEDTVLTTTLSRGRKTETDSGYGSFAFGNDVEASGSYSHAEGQDAVASGSFSHAEGYSTNALGSSSHAEGSGTSAEANVSHAEGSNTVASGAYGHAEGLSTKSLGQASHAEGTSTKARGSYSHAEGQNAIAFGTGSHAEGIASLAYGLYSHAEGGGTISLSNYEHAFGTYNSPGKNDSVSTWKSNKNYFVDDIVRYNDSGTIIYYRCKTDHTSGETFSTQNWENISTADKEYAETVGHGQTNNRRNIRTLDVQGNETLAGKLTLGASPSENMDAATKQYVDTAISTNVVGPESSTNNNIAVFDGTTGKAVKDGGKTISDIETQIDAKMAGPSSSTSNAIPVFNGTDGLTLKNSDLIYELIDSVGTLSKDRRVGTTKGAGSFAFGTSVEASARDAHAEGYATKAGGNYSHAEGDRSQALESATHAEGKMTVAAGYNAHAEGEGVIVYGNSSHGFGKYNIPGDANSYPQWKASTEYQLHQCVKATVNGTVKYYICSYGHTSGSSFSTSNWIECGNTTSYVETVGGGTENGSRANIRTLDWNGNETISGKLTLGSAPSNNMDAATKQYVDTGLGTKLNASFDSSDSGKFLRVSSTGAIVAETILNASGVSF